MKRRVIRGGSYLGDTWVLRSTFRYGLVPEFQIRNLGFRIVIRRVKAQK